MQLGEKLTNLRRESGLTQDELAKKIYVTRTAISKWENGKSYPGIDSLKLLSKVYNVSLDELISDDDVVAARNAKIRRSRTFYWCAVGCLVFAVAFILAAGLSSVPWLFIPGAAGVLGYVGFAFASKPTLSAMPRSQFVRYIASRAIVLAIVVGIIVYELVRIF